MVEGLAALYVEEEVDSLTAQEVVPALSSEEPPRPARAPNQAEDIRYLSRSPPLKEKEHLLAACVNTTLSALFWQPRKQQTVSSKAQDLVSISLPEETCSQPPQRSSSISLLLLSMTSHEMVTKFLFRTSKRETLERKGR